MTVDSAVQLLEGFEDLANFIRPDPGTGIHDADDKLIAILPRLHIYPTLLGKTTGITQQVKQDLPDANAVTVELG